MPTGFLFGGHCHESYNDAVDAYFSSSAAQLNGGDTLYLYEFTKTDAWRLSSYQIGSQGGTTLRYSILAKVPTFATCDVDKTNFWDLPSTEAYQAAWQAGFVIPMTIGLIAYCVGQIVKVWKD